MKQPISQVFNGDCMEYMAGLPDGFADLAICDPPYGIGRDGVSHTRNNGRGRRGFEFKGWDTNRPGSPFFKSLFRVSKNQIIWGANYFTEFLLPSMGWIFWDKGQRIAQSDGELAFSSFDVALRVAEYGRHLLALENTIHPTQKPVALYKWLLKNYAKPGDKIFDPMMGSQSSRIAAWDMGFDFWGCELDTDYFEQGCARFEKHRANKTSLFDPKEMYFEQTKLKI